MSTARTATQADALASLEVALACLHRASQLGTARAADGGPTGWVAAAQVADVESLALRLEMLLPTGQRAGTVPPEVLDQGSVRALLEHARTLIAQHPMSLYPPRTPRLLVEVDEVLQGFWA